MQAMISRATDDEKKWRAELDRLGIRAVQRKLDQSDVGHDALVGGFQCGEIERGVIEEWLAEKERESTRQQATILVWAQIAGVASMLAVLLAIVVLWRQ
jgi:hypothetical protein